MAKAKSKATKGKGKAKIAPKTRNHIASEFNREAAKTPTWKAKDVAKARAAHNGVSCVHKGKTTHHSSLHMAWIDLGLTKVNKDGSFGGAFSQHQTFRKALKIKKRLPYTLDGKTYTFAITKGE